MRGEPATATQSLLVPPLPAAVLHGRNAPRSFARLFSSQQKFTLPHTAAWQPFSQTPTPPEILRIPPQRFRAASGVIARPSAREPKLLTSRLMGEGKQSASRGPPENGQNAVICCEVPMVPMVPMLNCSPCRINPSTFTLFSL